ncbi:MAG: hypothetical protein AB2799_17955 [Candidatus Thiodiazotropha sp.]
MSVLTSKQIVKGIIHGKPIAPFSIDIEILDQYIDLIMAEKITVSTEANDVLRMFQHLKEQFPFVSTARRNQLLKCKIFILPFPLCISYAWEQSDQKIIVIGRGFIDLIANSIHSAAIQSTLPSDLDRRYREKYRRNMPATELLANALFLLQLRYYRYCEPLPNASVLLPKNIFQQSRKSINGALLFTLLHELGHHELGHIEIDEIRPMYFEQINHETLTVDQHQELEADAFALESLISSARVLGTYWQQQAVNFFIQMELVSGRHSGAEHPLAINRAYFAESQRTKIKHKDDIPSRHPLFKELVIRHNDSKAHVQKAENRLIQTSREVCLSVLSEINEALKDFNIDLSPLWTSSYPGWLDIPINQDEG